MRERNESLIVTDITIYGATSFVARHILNYITEVGPSLSRKIKVTLAGRNETKLNKVLETFAPKMEEKGKFVSLDVIVAASTDHAALKKMTTRSRVLLNCAGPFELYSSLVVGACAESGCDYVDITGEVHWVGDMRVKYGSAAAKSGARIVSLCGFDSVPSDLAIFAAVQALRKALPANKTPEIETARTWHACVGMAGGGTLATMKNMDIDVSKCLINTDGKPRKVPLMCFDPLVLTHPETVRFNPDYAEARDRMAWKEWLNCLPFPHTIFQQGVSIPFFMAVANAKVVHASAVALNYGPKFTYQERWLPLGFKLTLGFGLFSTIPSLMMLWFLSMATVVIKLPIVGDLFLKIFAPPGTGASDAMCERGYAQVYAEVKAPIANAANKVSCANSFVEFQGDPGNWVTAQCVVESALSLLLNRKELPPRSKDGFGTPAELMGPVLLGRLQNTKVRPVKVKTHVRPIERDHEYKVYIA